MIERLQKETFLENPGKKGANLLLPPLEESDMPQRVIKRQYATKKQLLRS